MNREIKFRAWSIKDKGWIAGFNMVNFHSYYNKGLEPSIYRYSTSWNLSDIELMQFTGLKDKNGKEIWEGDKVKRRVWLVEGRDYMDYTCEVRWNGWCYALFVADKQLWGLDPSTARECEVIGNIHEP